jgi:hypothetical protein
MSKKPLTTTIMKQFFQKIINLIRLKSPCCNAKMENVDIEGTSLIYECQKCSKQWF